MGDENGDEPDEQGTTWYCRHCGATGTDENPPTTCPSCGKPN
jgi:rubrerythrin